MGHKAARKPPKTEKRQLALPVRSARRVSAPAQKEGVPAKRVGKATSAPREPGAGESPQRTGKNPKRRPNLGQLGLCAGSPGSTGKGRASARMPEGMSADRTRVSKVLALQGGQPWGLKNGEGSEGSKGSGAGLEREIRTGLDEGKGCIETRRANGTTRNE